MERSVKVRHRLGEATGSPLSRFVNTLRPRQHGRHFPDDIFKDILE